MQEGIINSINYAVDELIRNSLAQNKINKLIKKHSDKIHFIPNRYRILGGILQSMNIQFGNFLETTIKNIIELNPNNEILTEFSGKKTNSFSVSKQSIRLVDDYIAECQTENNSEQNLQDKFDFLIDTIIQTEAKKQKIEKLSYDIDLLFQQKDTHRIVYVEIKYNDDHDTGKFVSINRKFLLTIALLIKTLNIKDRKQIQPILMYFNNKKMKGNIYLPESSVIYRGKRFFDTFTTIDYNELDLAFSNISNSKEINNKFDSMCRKILSKKEG